MNLKGLSRNQRILLAVFILACIVRTVLYYLLLNSPVRYYSQVPGLDMNVLICLGKLFYNGSGKFSIYRGAVAFFYWLNGDNFLSESIVLLQMLCGAWTACMISYISLRLSGKRSVALIAGVIAATYAPELMYESVTLKESIYLFFSVLSMASVLRWRKKRDVKSSIVAGTLLVLPAFIRFAAFLWTASVWGWSFLYLLKKSGKRKASILLFYIILGGTLVVSSVAGVNIFNCKTFNPFLMNFTHLQLQMNIASRTKLDQLNPEKKSKKEPEKSPETLATRIVRRIKRSSGFFIDVFKPYEICNNINYYFLKNELSMLRYMPGPALIIPISVTGLIILIFTGGFFRKESLLFLYLAAFIVPIILFVPLGRYRLIMLPVFCFSVAWLVEYFYRLVCAKRRGIPGIIAVIFLYSVILYATNPRSYPLRDSDFITLGKASEIKYKGINARVIDCYYNAFTLKPESVAAAVNLGRCLLVTGRYNDAVRFLERAHSINPDNFGVTMLYLSSLLASGNASLADRVFKTVMIPKSDKEKLTYYYNLGECKRALRQYKQALVAYNNALKYVANENGRRTLNKLIRSIRSMLPASG